MIGRIVPLLALAAGALLVAPAIGRDDDQPERDRSAPVAQGAPRVASSGLCADLMLLMLADDGQIVALSSQSRGPLAAFPEKAARFPQHRGSAEEIIAAGTDILLVDRTVDQRSALALAKFGVKVVEVSNASSWKEIEAMTRTVAKALQQPARAEAVLGEMNRRLALHRRDTPRDTWPTLLYYRPDMGGAGEGTAVSAAIEAAGFRNRQVDWGPPMWSGVPIERVVHDPPDIFATSYFDTNRTNGNILRRNPVLWGSARTRPVVNVSGRYWNCGSPAIIEAVEQLASARRQYFPDHQ